MSSTCCSRRNPRRSRSSPDRSAGRFACRWRRSTAPISTTSCSYEGCTGVKVAALQMTSGPDVATNLAVAQGLLADAAAAGARLAALPENFAFMGLEDADKRKVAEEEGAGPIQTALTDAARRLGLWIIAGT